MIMQGQQGRKLLLIELVVPPFFILLTVIIRMCAACYLLQLLHTDTCSSNIFSRRNVYYSLAFCFYWAYANLCSVILFLVMAV